MIPETTTAGTRKFDLEEVEEPPQQAAVPEVSEEEKKRRYDVAVKRIFSKPKKGKVLDPWALTTLMAKENIAALFTTKMTAKVLMVDNLSAKQRLDRAMEVGEAMINDENAPKELRLKGIEIMTAAVRIQGEMSERVLKLAEKVGQKAANENGLRKKNLPPVTGVELTVGEGASKTTARVVAGNGGSGR